MDHINLIKQLTSKINQQETIETQSVLGNIHSNNVEEQAVLQLFLLYRNICQSKPEQKQTGWELLVLEQLTIIAANLARFSEPLDSIAKFDRLMFHDKFKKSSNPVWKKLSEKVYGVYSNRDLKQYPYDKSVIFSLERSQNSLTIIEEDSECCRKVLEAIYKKAKSSEERQFYEILLCMSNELEKEKYKDYAWRDLWTHFYIWTVETLNNQNINKNAKKVVLQTQILKTIQDKGRQIDIIICRLLLSIINASNQSTKYCSDLQQAASKYLSYSKGRRPMRNSSLIGDICSTLFLRDCLKTKHLPGLVYQCDEKLLELQEHISEDSSFQEDQKIQLISYFLADKNLTNYLLKFRLPFWNYGLSEESSSDLAQKFLSQTPEEHQVSSIDWQKVIESLSPEMLRRIFQNPQKWNYSVWSTHFLHLCQEPTQKFMNKVGQVLENSNAGGVKHDLLKFHEQWSVFLNSSTPEKTQIQRDLLRQLITFDFDVSVKFKKICKFPQNINEVFLKSCIKHVQLLQEENYLEDFEIEFAFNPAYVQNLINFSAGSWDVRWDEYWKLWTQILLKDNKFMKGLIGMEPQPFDIKEEEEEKE